MKRSIILILIFAVASALAAVNFPYPQEKAYANGTYVSGQSATLKAKFQTFLSNYYEENGSYARIKFDDGSYTVSEGIGYGMLMMVYFSDNSTSYQSHFDKLWNYYNNHLDDNGLMNWKISGFSGTAGEGAATDAEFDVALALIQAYYQFGDEKYKTAASNLIAKIRQYEMESNGLHKPGDKWDSYRNPSYVSPAAFELFKKFDDASFWSTALTVNYALLKNNQNSSTGLPSGWSDESGTPVSGNTGYIAYDYDAPRAPWRWAMSYLWYGHSDAATLLSKLSAWVNNQSVGNLKVPMGLDGGSTSAQGWSNATAIGPLTCAMLYSKSYESRLKNNTSALLSKGTESYFNDAMQILSGLLLTGNMQNLANLNATEVSSSSAESSSSVKESSSSVAKSSSSSKAESSSSVKEESSSSSKAESSSSVAKSSSSSKAESSSSAAKTSYSVTGSLSQTVAKESAIETVTISGITSYNRDSWNLSSFNLGVEQSGTSLKISGTIPNWAETGTKTETFTINGEKVTFTLTIVEAGSLSSSSSAESSSSSEEATALPGDLKTLNFSVQVIGKSLEISGSTVNVEVFDMQGRLLKQLPQVTGSVSLEAMQSGTYLVRVRSGKANWTKRISLR